MMFNMRSLAFSLLLAIFILPGRACDNHGPSVRMCTWHVKALKPQLMPIAAGSVDTTEVFAKLTDVLDRGGAHLGEAYAVLGVPANTHIDILQLYAERQGKPFQQEPKVTETVNALVQIRDQKKYMADCSYDLQQLRASLAGSVKDTLLIDALGSAIDMYEQSGSFWDVAASEYNLEAKSDKAIRREHFDLLNFTRYYMALRELGLNHYGAHALASLETAYAATRCDHCGVW